MFYLDASVVVATLVPEEGTGRVQGWLHAQAAGQISISNWVETEVSSALSMKTRLGHISADDRARILGRFNTLVREVWDLVDVRGSHFRNAGRFCDNHELSLRAGDALHLAIASGHGLTVCTLDRRLAEAGPKLGIPALLI
ncbi:MAG: type II toxin-antitoxin system VapC family toxin [Sphingomonadales bacterium]